MKKLVDIGASNPREFRVGDEVVEIPDEVWAAGDRGLELDDVERKFFDEWPRDRMNVMIALLGNDGPMRPEDRLEILHGFQALKAAFVNGLDIRINDTKGRAFLTRELARMMNEHAAQKAALREQAKRLDPARREQELDEARRAGRAERDQEIEIAKREVAALKRRVEELTTAKARLREALDRARKA